MLASLARLGYVTSEDGKTFALWRAQDGRADTIHFVFDGDLAAEFVTCF